MRILMSTFGQDDEEKVLSAMRALPYDRLVLLGNESILDSDGFKRLSSLEDMAGHSVETVLVSETGFMELVDEISSALQEHVEDGVKGGKNHLVLNISGGEKLLGDAALFAAFRVGVEVYHCEKAVTKLPVLRGVTARDMFTPMQSTMIVGIGTREKELSRVYSTVRTSSRQAAERIVRELKRMDIIRSEAREGKIYIELTETGKEVLMMIGAARGRKLPEPESNG